MKNRKIKNWILCLLVIGLFGTQFSYASASFSIDAFSQKNISVGAAPGGSRPLAWQLKFTTSPENGVMTVTLPKEYAGSKLMFYDGKNWQQVSDLSQTPLLDGYFYAVLTN